MSAVADREVFGVCVAQEQSREPTDHGEPKDNWGQIPIQEAAHIGEKAATTKLGSDPICCPTTLANVFKLLEAITDPEIPVVTIAELGILRDVQVAADGSIQVFITPTYSGCPAVDQIEADIRSALRQAGYSNVRISTQLAPAWTTDWIGPAAKAKLRAYGIAPPHTLGEHTKTSSRVIAFAPKNRANNDHFTPACPQCDSKNVTETSHFGSTACKALYKCLNCMEPFDYFKPY